MSGTNQKLTPYVTGSGSVARPYEPYYMDPVYDVSDNFGATDADGNEMGDGIIDNPGRILFKKRTRTAQKDNYSLGVGFSMTWSTPTDKSLQDLCKKAARANIALMNQAWLLTKDLTLRSRDSRIVASYCRRELCLNLEQDMQVCVQM